MKIFKKEDFAEVNVFGTGAENTGYAQYFQGNSFLLSLIHISFQALFSKGL